MKTFLECRDFPRWFTLGAKIRALVHGWLPQLNRFL